MYELLGICLTLAALLVINACISLLASAFWRVIERQTRRWSAQSRARAIFALRTLPLAGATLFVFGFLIPSYIAFEPYKTDEIVTFKLFIIAAVSALGMALAVWRAFAAWRATAALVRDWMRRAEPLIIENVRLPAYLIEHQFPVVAIVGALRPRLFIARRAYRALERDEFRAVVAHEIGHLEARDNFKRALTRACRDLLMIVPCGRALDRAWKDYAEAAADEFAVRREGRKTALDLASALIKIARLAAVDAKPTLPAGAFLIEDNAGFEWRVRRLAAMSDENFARENVSTRFLNAAFWLGSLLCLLTVFALLLNSDFLIRTHNLIERIVSLLQ
jgi:Zn-dependent protease with chaperone function